MKIEEIRTKHSIIVNSQEECDQVIKYLSSLNEKATSGLNFHSDWNKINFEGRSLGWCLCNKVDAGYKLPSITFSELKTMLGDNNMKYKFKIGDKVKIVKSGYGCSPSSVTHKVIITELGKYLDRPGYKIDNLEIDTNSKNNRYQGFIDEQSFELVEQSEEKWIPKVGDWVVFEESRCVGHLENHKTSCWKGNLILKIDNISSTCFEFNLENAKKLGTNYNFSMDFGNRKELFRPALPHEIPTSETSTEFALPEKWCVKITKENAKTIGDFYGKHSWNGYKTLIPKEEVGKYYTSHNVSSGTSVFSKDNGSYFHLSSPSEGYTEITFEQFKKYVLKSIETEVKPNVMNKEQLLEEAKRKFPIGTKFKAPDNNREYTVEGFDGIESNGWLTDYHVLACIKEHKGVGQYLYYHGKWAEVIEPVKPNLIVGKWYMLPKTSNFIVKYSSVGSCSEYIANAKHYSYGGSCCTTDAILVDLSEIQQYLPDGHCDKLVKVSMEDIQRQCKEKYPIGCTFKVGSFSSISILKNDSTTYKIDGDNIYAGYMQGLLYRKGVWATLISLPEKPKEKTMKTQFEKGDYIVVLSGRSSTKRMVNNYIYKQFENDSSLWALSNLGEIYQTYDVKFDQSIDKWRYATTEEIAEYDRLGKPYDVTTLQSKPTETLLEKGKRLYPIGTIYNPLDSMGDTYMEPVEVIHHRENGTGLDFGYGYVYVKSADKWADIIKHAPVEVQKPVSKNLVKHGVELIPGEYYYYKVTSEFLFEYVDSDGNVKNEINLSEKQFSNQDVLSFSLNTLRKATPEEISHVKQCVAAGKYVDYVPVDQYLSYGWKVIDFRDYYPQALVLEPSDKSDTVEKIKPILIDVPRI